MEEKSKTRLYKKKDSVIFAKTNEKFGGLSNMASGFPLFINGNVIPSAEALYQAMRYPLFPDIQYEIIIQNSPMTAKMISKKYYHFTRQDWDSIRIKIMRWVLEIKLSQHWEKFSRLLKETGNQAIVEYSAKDKVWGASKLNEDELIGINALGRLLMELREKYVIPSQKLECVNSINITGLLLYGYSIDQICNEDIFQDNEDQLEKLIMV